MSMGARDAAIKKFTDDPSCRIFLMSLKAGGVALNLTVASHVRILFSVVLLQYNFFYWLCIVKSYFGEM